MTAAAQESKYSADLKRLQLAMDRAIDDNDTWKQMELATEMIELDAKYYGMS